MNGERKPFFSLELEKMKQMELSALHLGPRLTGVSFKTLLLPAVAEKKQKQKTRQVAWLTEITMMKIPGQLDEIYILLIKKERVKLYPFAHQHLNFCHTDVALLKSGATVEKMEKPHSNNSFYNHD